MPRDIHMVEYQEKEIDGRKLVVYPRAIWDEMGRKINQGEKPCLVTGKGCYSKYWFHYGQTSPINTRVQRSTTWLMSGEALANQYYSTMDVSIGAVEKPDLSDIPF